MIMLRIFQAGLFAVALVIVGIAPTPLTIGCTVFCGLMFLMTLATR